MLSSLISMAKWITVVRKEFHRSIYKESGKLYPDFVFLTAELMQLSDGRYVHIRWKATLCRPERTLQSQSNSVSGQKRLSAPAPAHCSCSQFGLTCTGYGVGSDALCQGGMARAENV